MQSSLIPVKSFQQNEQLANRLLSYREKTVVGLVSLGASPGALTDPSAEFPLGRTPADLASANGHKGISGFLAESSLTTHLSKLTVTDATEELASEVSGAKVGETVTERVAVTTTGDDVPDVLSLKDSLAAIRNATQAAARIHQIFRVQSFQRKQIIERSDNELSSDENALSIVASRACKLGQNNGIAHAAATQIQKKFRGWNKRKEFLLIRQKIVKIQVHCFLQITILLYTWREVTYVFVAVDAEVILPLCCLTNFHMQNFIHESGCVMWKL